jgi:putative hydrolase of the HAD superfamily
LCGELGVAAGRRARAVAALDRLGDRRRSGQVLWSEPTPHALDTIRGLRRAGIEVLVVSNSDGHAEDNLREAAVCQPGPGPGATVAAVIDSTVVGVEKPDPGIFRIALREAGAEASSVVHVGDLLSTDVAGARAAGIEPIHFDPTGGCREREHRHLRSLRGIWRHVMPPSSDM